MTQCKVLGLLIILADSTKELILSLVIPKKKELVLLEI